MEAPIDMAYLHCKECSNGKTDEELWDREGGAGLTTRPAARDHVRVKATRGMELSKG